VTCEYLHSLVVRSEGSLYSWGDATEGQVGDGTFTDRPSPVPVGPSFVWRSAAAGGFFSVALRHDGSLYTWGANNYGQLGLGGVDYAHKSSPQRVGSANDWVAAAAGMYHVLALKANGTLWAWGYNFDGQLGIGSRTSTNVPTQVGSATDWVAITAGGYASHGIKADGSLYSWGNNGFGQLGLGDQTLRTTPTRVGSANTWVAVSGGGNHTLGLTVAGGAFAWGSNLQGQLGTGEGTFKTTPTAVSPATGWTRISGGDFQSHGVRNDGTLYGWGLNSTGQLGDASLVDRPLPTLIGSGYATATGGLRHSLLAKSAGDVYATGGNASGQLGWGVPGETSSPAFVIRLWDWISANITSPTSSSHPVQTNWYSDATADLQWTASDDSGLYGFSIAFGATPTTPDLWLDLAAGATTTTSPALADGVTYFTIQARDAGASWSAPAMRAIRVDTTAPSAVPSVWSPSHPYSWSPDNTPTFAWDAATDATSGVAGYSWNCARAPGAHADASIDGTDTTVTLGPLGEGRWEFAVRAVDRAGNAGAAKSETVGVDTEPPFTTDDADALWHRRPVSVRLRASDATSGYTFTSYRIDGGEWQAGEDVVVTLRTWKRGGGSGLHTIEYYSHDFAANEEVVRSCQVKLDARAPVTWCDAPLVPTPGPVTVTLAPTDAHSGVDVTWWALDGSIWWNAGTTVRVAGAGVHFLRYYSVDNVGNVEYVRERTFTVL
jgi:alpha-tubulin suppressor-like RCC1 family protein